MRLYRDRRHKDNLHGVAILDTERILKNKTELVERSTSLASEVKTDHSAARAFIDLLLGHYTKCDTLEELRDYRTAVTRECFVRRNYTDSHINPRIYGRWFIGERAVASQVESRQQRLDEITHEMTSLNERDFALRERLTLTRDKIRPLIDLEHALEALDILPERSTQHESLTQELADLDLRNTDSLKTAVDQHQAEYNRLQTEAGSVERRIGGMEADAQTLAEGEIPRLEREIDQSIQNAEEFHLSGENPDAEVRSEIDKEYARRLERQPVDVIQQNAERYENDYQTAETRNRDRLREAKQAYSMRYDFGYDNDDNATRYMAEHKS